MKIMRRVILNQKEVTGCKLRAQNLNDMTSESPRLRVERVLSWDFRVTGDQAAR